MGRKRKMSTSPGGGLDGLLILFLGVLLIGLLESGVKTLAFLPGLIIFSLTAVLIVRALAGQSGG